MGQIVFNRSKGRVTEFGERVNGNDPANSVFIVAMLASTGLEADSVLIDKDDFSGLVSGATDMSTNTGSTRKSIDNTGGITVTYNDTLDRTEVDIPDQTWTAVANDGTGGVGALVTGYDSDSTGGTDANILPMTKHDFAVTPDGSDITATVADFFRAS